MNFQKMLLLCCALFLARQSLAQDANPAIIAGYGETARSVGYVETSGAEVINADIGRWDTPYPYPDTGEYAPGLQPVGRSEFYIDVDVNDGTIAAFRYALQTYDAGIYDWYDIYMQTPDGQITLVNKLGKPGSQYGTYWASAPISLSKDLTKWRDSRVRFIFSVMQDGWGDQTRGQLFGFALSSCQVPPLTPLTDADALRFEAANGNIADVDPTNFHLTTELNCMENAVSNAGGSYNLVSGYRPPAYQTHLREVYDAWQLLENRREPECETLRDEVSDEIQTHNLAYRPAASSAHSRGDAFDLAITGLSSQQIDASAQQCGLYRFSPTRDPNHFSRP